MLNIFSATGQLVEYDSAVRVNSHSFSLNIGDLEPGMYLFQLITEKGITSKKLMKK